MGTNATMHPGLLSQLASSGFERLDESRWWLSTTRSPGGYTGRGAYFIVREDGGAIVYSIDVEEFRGGEGYEEEVARTTSPDDAMRAIIEWAAWANEPWERPTPPTSRFGRMRAWIGAWFGLRP